VAFGNSSLFSLEPGGVWTRAYDRFKPSLLMLGKTGASLISCRPLICICEPVPRQESDANSVPGFVVIDRGQTLGWVSRFETRRENWDIKRPGKVSPMDEARPR
jgi:hypothetical protein